MDSLTLAKEMKNMFALIKASEIKNLKGDAFIYASLSINRLMLWVDQVEKDAAHIKREMEEAAIKTKEEMEKKALQDERKQKRSKRQKTKALSVESVEDEQEVENVPEDSAA